MPQNGSDSARPDMTDPWHLAPQTRRSKPRGSNLKKKCKPVRPPQHPVIAIPWSTAQRPKCPAAHRMPPQPIYSNKGSPIEGSSQRNCPNQLTNISNPNLYWRPISKCVPNQASFNWHVTRYLLITRKHTKQHHPFNDICTRQMRTPTLNQGNFPTAYQTLELRRNCDDVLL